VCFIETQQSGEFLRPTVSTLVYGLAVGMLIVLLLGPCRLAIQLDVAPTGSPRCGGGCARQNAAGCRRARGLLIGAGLALGGAVCGDHGGGASCTGALPSG